MTMESSSLLDMSGLETQAELTRNLSPSIHVVHTTAKWSFHVVERVKTAAKCTKIKNRTCKAC